MLDPIFRINLRLSEINEVMSKFDPSSEIHKKLTLFLFKQQLNNNSSALNKPENVLDIEKQDWNEIQAKINAGKPEL